MEKRKRKCICIKTLEKITVNCDKAIEGQAFHTELEQPKREFREKYIQNEWLGGRWGELRTAAVVL